MYGQKLNVRRFKVAPRPKSENPKNLRFEIRLTQDTEKILELCCKKTGLSKAEVIRLGIQKVYEEVTKK